MIDCIINELPKIIPVILGFYIWLGLTFLILKLLARWCAKDDRK